MSINFKVLAVFKEDENMRVAVKLLENKGYDVFHEASVSHDIIEKHGGSLTVRSRKEKGTVFQIILPIETT